MESMECVNKDVWKKKKDRYLHILMDGTVKGATMMESLDNRYGYL